MVDPHRNPGSAQPDDDHLAFTVASIWRAGRVSCPHPDILKAAAAGALDAAASEFIDFHLRESQCPYCNAIHDELRARDEAASRTQLRDLKDRLMRSTVTELRRLRGS